MCTIKRYKIIKEYQLFYLTIDENGFKECFKKRFHQPTDDGYIEIKVIKHDEYMPQMCRKVKDKSFGNYKKI